MTGEGQEQYEDGPRRYISSLGFVFEGESIEQAQDATNELIEWAETKGFKLMDGSTGLMREREAIEQVSYASTEVFRNITAERMSPAHATRKGDDRREAATAN